MFITYFITEETGETGDLFTGITKEKQEIDSDLALRKEITVQAIIVLCWFQFQLYFFTEFIKIA